MGQILGDTVEAASWPTIGLLAGMGVRSTAPFLELVIEECRSQYGAVQQPDFPQMIVFSWPTPFRIDRPLDHEAMRSRIAEGLAWLERTGVDFMAMPANLPHLYFDDLVRGVGTPLLNLVDGVVDALPAGSGTAAVLATRPIRDAGLYQRAFEKVGVETLADDAVQDVVDALLGDLWAGHPPAELATRWTRLLGDVRARGASLALLACTDLNAVARDGSEMPVLDATRLMARRVVAQWCSLVADRGVSPGSAIPAPPARPRGG